MIEGAFGNPSLADNAALESENPGLAFAQRAHHPEALDRGVGRLRRLETAHRRISSLSLPWSASTILLRYFTYLCLVSPWM